MRCFTRESLSLWKRTSTGKMPAGFSGCNRASRKRPLTLTKSSPVFDSVEALFSTDALLPRNFGLLSGHTRHTPPDGPVWLACDLSNRRIAGNGPPITDRCAAWTPENAEMEFHGVGGLPFEFVTQRSMSCETPRVLKGFRAQWTSDSLRRIHIDE